MNLPQAAAKWLGDFTVCGVRFNERRIARGVRVFIEQRTGDANHILHWSLLVDLCPRGGAEMRDDLSGYAATFILLTVSRWIEQRHVEVVGGEPPRFAVHRLALLSFHARSAVGDVSEKDPRLET